MLPAAPCTSQYLVRCMLHIVRRPLHVACCAPATRLEDSDSNSREIVALTVRCSATPTPTLPPIKIRIAQPSNLAPRLDLSPLQAGGGPPPPPPITDHPTTTAAAYKQTNPSPPADLGSPQSLLGKRAVPGCAVRTCRTVSRAHRPIRSSRTRVVLSPVCCTRCGWHKSELGEWWVSGSCVCGRDRVSRPMFRSAIR